MTDIVISLEIALEYQDGADTSRDVTPFEGKINRSQFDVMMEERKRMRIHTKREAARRSRKRKRTHIEALETENDILRARLSELDKVISSKGDTLSKES
ncbi:hypothetical protein L2E82_48660 [Cichorium intybus]|uniref:Uncharacterized protein n=1 Tax=Cichorium intybus TaxID=13427 RepID=A0ACB8Z026_CICIN|nr:hypothetical protein L2E82_48660 [Cichorium intybus]